MIFSGKCELKLSGVAFIPSLLPPFSLLLFLPFFLSEGWSYNVTPTAPKDSSQKVKAP